MKINQIYNIDCLEGIKKLENESIDLLITSPPYYNAKEYSYWSKYEDYLLWLNNVFSILYNKMKSGRMLCINLSVIIQPRKNRNAESLRIAIPFHFVNIMEKIGYKFLEDIIWIKPEGSSKNRNGRFYQDRQPIQYKPNIINEYILVFQKPINGLIDKILKSYPKDVKEVSLIKDDYERTNIWYIHPETKSKHPAPFPYELPEKLIKYYSYKNDLIVDIFAGSGTTCKAAKDLNRNYIGFELNKEYYDLAYKKINNL